MVSAIGPTSQHLNGQQTTSGHNELKSGATGATSNTQQPGAPYNQSSFVVAMAAAAMYSNHVSRRESAFQPVVRKASFDGTHNDVGTTSNGTDSSGTNSASIVVKREFQPEPGNNSRVRGR